MFNKLVAGCGVLAACSCGIAMAAAPIPNTYSLVGTRSQIPAVLATPRPGFNVIPYSFSYAAARGHGVGDFNGDGFQDIVLFPQSIQVPVDYFQVEFWLNNGDYTFRKATSEVIDGPAPYGLSPDEVVVHDFNRDGRPDVMFSDSGMEYPQTLQDSGGQLVFLLSQPNGKLANATSFITPNPRRFHHGIGIGDFNGDGYEDIAFNQFTMIQYSLIDPDQPEGISVMTGDGTGHFVDATAELPQEIRFMKYSERTTPDWQFTGCNTLSDVDGDGIAELLTGSANFDQNPQKTRTIRFFKRQQGLGFVEHGRAFMSNELANIGFFADTIALDPQGRGLSCSQLLTEDLDRDGRQDVVVQWEGEGKNFIQLLRNDGGFQFHDVTMEWLGFFSTSSWIDGSSTFAGRIRTTDLNLDGVPDLAFWMTGDVTALLKHSAFLNDGTGHLTPLVPTGLNGPFAQAEIAPAACLGCYHVTMFMPMAPGEPPSWIFREFLSDTDAGPPMQSKSITLTVLKPVLPTLSAGNVAVTEGNSGTKLANFSVQLSQVLPTPVKFDAFTSPGTAIAGVDYASNAVMDVTIPAGQASAPFAVTINGDTSVESNETFAVNLANVVGARAAPAQAQGRILNDDLAQLSIADASVVEGQSGETTLSFVVTLSRAMPSPVFFDIATSNGTATAGSDFVARSQTGRFLDAGRTRQVFEVAVKGDATTEPNETFNVTLSNVNGAIVGDGVAVGTILNDDAAAVAPARAKLRRAVRPAP